MAETGKKQQVQLETEIRGGVASSAVFRGTLPESAGVSAEVHALSRTGKQSNAGLTKQVFSGMLAFCGGSQDLSSRGNSESRMIESRVNLPIADFVDHVGERQQGLAMSDDDHRALAAMSHQRVAN